MKVAQILKTLDYGPAPEAAKPALDWIAEHEGKFGIFINGKWRDPSSKEWFDSINPSNNKKLARIAQGSKKDVDDAVKAARAAFKGWSATPGHIRARYLYAIARQVQKHSRLFAVLETMDNGKPIRETRDIDIPLVARHFYHHAGWAQLADTEMRDYQPLGVVGQIIPWNFPLLMLSWKIAPALAMGNTVVLKPAELTSLTALLFAEICNSVGLPAGVVNIVTGDGKTGAAIVEHPGIDKIAFTGSTEVGRIIRRATAGTGKKLSLELGGKSPFIVFDDADLDSAVEGVVDAIWFNQGQVCCAGSRLLVQEGVAEKVYKKLRARMEKMRVGDPLDKGIDIGAIVDTNQLKQIQDKVARGVEEGATLMQPSWANALPAGGCYFPPTVLTNVGPASSVVQQEIFGPVLAAMTFRTPEEAVKLANNTRYGLAATIWSEDINLALDIATQIKAGTVWINSTNLLDAAAGFGGYRESGFGREGGKEGLYEYTKHSLPSPGSGGRAGDGGALSNSAKHKTLASTATSSQKALKTPANKGVPKTVAPTKVGAQVAFGSAVNIDRTAKMFIGGKQARPDGGLSINIYGPNKNLIGEVGAGNRKDIRNAVEAARAAANGWAKATAHNRAQVVYFMAENLAARAAEFASRLIQQTGCTQVSADAEVEASIAALFTAAAWADKYDGRIHGTPHRNVTLAMNEPMGVIGMLMPDDHPLLALATLAGTALAMGNAMVVVPSPKHPLSATDLYQVLETSDVPHGTFNIVTGERDELAKTLSEHDDVDSVWYAGTAEGQTAVQKASAGNMKRTWVLGLTGATGALPGVDEILREATQVKNVWVPYGA
ncbi:MAG: aldehyde dehydrogenase family protein [Rhodocyclaceae bacterium]|nr:aldehyde dehydrogenase family protein [Rhodocyclaceae bacterium]